MQTVRGGAARKTERLRDMVSEAGQCGELMSLQVPLPLDPTVLLNGIIPASCSVFKSAMAPIRLTFRVAGETVVVLLRRCLWQLHLQAATCLSRFTVAASIQCAAAASFC